MTGGEERMPRRGVNKERGWRERERKRGKERIVSSVTFKLTHISTVLGGTLLILNIKLSFLIY